MAIYDNYSQEKKARSIANFGHWREADGSLDQNINTIHITIDDKYVKLGYNERNMVRYRQSADIFYVKRSELIDETGRKYDNNVVPLTIKVIQVF